MTEERGKQQQYSEREISEKLDELIGAWHEVEATRGALREFHAKYEHPPPPPSMVFEDALSLAEYNSAEARYSHKLEEATERYLRSEERFQQAADVVGSILPRGTFVFHNYIPSREEPSERAGRYRLAHAKDTIDLVKVTN